MEEKILSRLADCEQTNRRLFRMVLFLLFVAAGGILVSCISTARVSAERGDSSVPRVLEVSELLVRDARGVVRVRIGGNLPDAMIQEKRVPRGDGAAGVLLYDTTGQERGG
jgi:hypothetical protein